MVPVMVDQLFSLKRGEPHALNTSFKKKNSRHGVDEASILEANPLFVRACKRMDHTKQRHFDEFASTHLE